MAGLAPAEASTRAKTRGWNRLRLGFRQVVIHRGSTRSAGRGPWRADSAQGGPGLGGTSTGDLYLEVVLAPHRHFHVTGRDVYLDLPVAPWEAALGAAVTVPTLGGKVDLRIPPGSQSGSRLRLRGRGLPGSPPGDQFAVLEIVTPKANTDRTRALYEQMKREMGFDPRAGLGG